MYTKLFALLLISSQASYCAAVAVGGSAEPPHPGATAATAVFDFESTVLDLMPLGNVKKIITEKNNEKLDGWLKRQIDRPSRTDEINLMLIRLALGLDHKTGWQSGWVSLDALGMVKSETSGALREALDWMHDVLTSKRIVFSKQLQNTCSNFPLLVLSIGEFLAPIGEQKSALGQKIYVLMESNRLLFYKKEQEFIDFAHRGVAAEEFESDLRKFGGVNAYRVLANNCINKKECRSAALYLRELIKRGFPLAFARLGKLIKDGCVTDDLYQNQVVNNYAAAEECFREAIKRKDVAGYSGLGLLILCDHILTDLHGKSITNKYEAAAECFRKGIEGNDATAFKCLGTVIINGHISKDLHGTKIVNKNEAAAECYRKAIELKDIEACGYLGVLIRQGKVKFDENNQRIKNKAQTAKRLLEMDWRPSSRLYLSILYLEHSLDLSNTERSEKISKLLKEDTSGDALVIQALACEKLLKDSVTSNNFWKQALEKGVQYKSLLFLCPVKEDVSDESEDEDTLQDLDSETDQLSEMPQPKPLVELTFQEKFSILQAHEYEARRIASETMELRFQNIMNVRSKKLEKIKAQTAKQLSRADQISAAFQSRIESTRVEKTVRFTPGAYEQFQSLDKIGRGIFEKHITSIQEGLSIGHAEMLRHQRLGDGTPVMTREMNGPDRLAYTDVGGVITILSMVGHYEGGR